MPRRLSNKIYIYSYILSFFVILVHSVNLAADNLSLMSAAAAAPLLSPAGIENLFSNTLGEGAVPGFFLLSGGLFFRDVRGIRGVFSKWRRRARTVLLPYCVWNSLYYLLYCAMGRELLSLEGWVYAVLNYSCNPVFWYLQQLILLILITPLILPIIDGRIGAVISPLLILLLIYMRADIPYINEDALFYFTVGAVLWRHGRWVMEEGTGLLQLILCIMLLLLIFYMEGDAVSFLGIGASIVITVLRRLMLPLILWFMLCSSYLPTAPFFMRHSFIIYALHYPVVRAMSHLLLFFGIIGESSLQLMLLLLSYFLMPPLCTGIAAFVSAALKRYFPWLLLPLSGGRNG